MISGILDYIKLKWHFNFYSKKRIERYQLKKIKKLINYSKKYSSFYKNEYKNKKIKTWDNYYELPLINKNKMMDNLTEINTINATKEELYEYSLNNELKKNYKGYFKNQYVVGLSSGTSGNKGIYITDKRLTKKLPFVFLARSGISLSLLPFNILFLLRVYSQGFDDINSTFIKLKYMSTMEKIDKVVKRINEQKINILMCPPSFLRQLLPEQDKILVRIKLIMTYAEVLTEEEKIKFENKFNCKVIEIYQTSEGQMASSCRCGNLHINEDLVFIELYYNNKKLDKKNIVADKMIITNLINFAHPLIRYEMNDLIVLGEKCKCGSNFRTIKKIIGRNDDIIYLYDKEGNVQYIFPDLFARWIITTSDEIREFKVVNNKIGQMEITIDVLNKKEIKSIIYDINKRLKEELKQYNIEQYELKIFVKKIHLPKDKNKYKRFIRNYTIN